MLRRGVRLLVALSGASACPGVLASPARAQLAVDAIRGQQDGYLGGAVVAVGDVDGDTTTDLLS